MLEPLYTAANCRVAYQLHWSLTLFANQPWPKQDVRWQPLREAVEPDGVRLLEFLPSQPAVGQFFVSSKPEISPAQIVRSVKGRPILSAQGGAAQAAKAWVVDAVDRPGPIGAVQVLRAL